MPCSLVCVFRMNCLLYLSVLLLAAVEMTTAGHFKVKCKEEQVTAKAGDDDVIQCRFYSGSKFGSVAFVWKKVNTKGIVYNYSRSQVNQTEQDPSYRNRAEVFASEIPQGNLSLRLRNVSLSDAGIYKLHVSSRSQSTDAQVLLSIRVSFHSGSASPENRVVGLGSWPETLCYYLWSYVRALTQCATLLTPYSSVLYKSRRDLEMSTFTWKYCFSHLDKLPSCTGSGAWS
ncbi:myelin-oligodendrocyte glycoprotein-like isoform X4 [Hemitrygon akajei]|uniref:myelin-oligodendrocyte glycoprotein-like isoform X4 n=1 Tax=Hemitrygon akajei TaxID=2704970 RepID=UPI003BF9681E